MTIPKTTADKSATRLTAGEVNWVSITAGILLAATILFLGASGPFFSATGMRTEQPVLSRFLVSDGSLATIVGTPDRDQAGFRSSGRGGALSFGPYITLQPGHYAISWIGSVRGPSHPTFDVFSINRGVIKENAPELVITTVQGTLQRLEFSLDRPTDNIEFRTVVGAGDDLSINAVELWKLK